MLCIILFVFLGMILVIAINTLLSKKLSVIGLCVLSIVISILAPCPIPEKVHLSLYRSEYQTVVELARNQQLVPQLD